MMIRETIDELAALGWHAVLHGPEAHIAMPWLYLVLALIILFWRKPK